MFNLFGTKPKAPAESQKKSIFGRQGYISRSKLLWKLGSGSMKIPGTDKWYNRQQFRKELGELFDPRIYGHDITEKEAREVLRKLNERYYGADWQKKVKIARQIKWLRREMALPKK